MLELYETLSTSLGEEEENKKKFEEEIEEDIKDLKVLDAKLSSILIGLYDVECPDDLSVCKNAHEVFPEVREKFSVLATKVPVDNQFKYRYMWRDTMQHLIFHASLVTYVELGKLMTKKNIMLLFGFSEKPESGKFSLEMDDYLLGILDLPEQLVQLSMVHAVRGDRKKSDQIMQFITDFNMGFKKLTLKNDILRRKYDSLKYHTKSAKDIVIDLDLHLGTITDDAESNVKETDVKDIDIN